MADDKLVVNNQEAKKVDEADLDLPIDGEGVSSSKPTFSQTLKGKAAKVMLTASLLGVEDQIAPPRLDREPPKIQRGAPQPPAPPADVRVADGFSGSSRSGTVPSTRAPDEEQGTVRDVPDDEEDQGTVTDVSDNENEEQGSVEDIKDPDDMIANQGTVTDVPDEEANAGNLMKGDLKDTGQAESADEADTTPPEVSPEEQQSTVAPAAIQAQQAEQQQQRVQAQLDQAVENELESISKGSMNSARGRSLIRRISGLSFIIGQIPTTKKKLSEPELKRTIAKLDAAEKKIKNAEKNIATVDIIQKFAKPIVATIETVIIPILLIIAAAGAVFLARMMPTMFSEKAKMLDRYRKQMANAAAPLKKAYERIQEIHKNQVRTNNRNKSIEVATRSDAP